MNRWSKSFFNNTYIFCKYGLFPSRTLRLSLLNRIALIGGKSVNPFIGRFDEEPDELELDVVGAV